MPVPDRILELTDQFGYNLDSYKGGKYNETQVRLEYINPLMEELGWDVRNKSGYSEAYKDVIHEDAIKVGGVTKAPDYCFRIGGTRKFFLEAKKPSVNIKEDIPGLKHKFNGVIHWVNSAHTQLRFPVIGLVLPRTCGSDYGFRCVFLTEQHA